MSEEEHMTQRKVPVLLTRVEASHVLALLQWNEQDGVYYGPKKEYWDRHDRIAVALKQAIDPEALE